MVCYNHKWVIMVYVGKSQVYRILKRSFIPADGGREVKICLKMTQMPFTMVCYIHKWVIMVSLSTIIVWPICWQVSGVTDTQKKLYTSQWMLRSENLP